MSDRQLPNRRTVVARLLRDRTDALVIPGLGAANYDVGAVGDHELNYYQWGAMGGAAMMGLGLALAQPERPVIVITGDGEMLMGMGAFATIGLQQPKNLHIVIMDNEAYGETGKQASHTQRADLAAVAAACGFERTGTIGAAVANATGAASAMGLADEAGAGSAAGVDAQIEALAALVHRADAGPSATVVKIDAAEITRFVPIRDGGYMKGRFRKALGLSID
ncbi:MAG: thiamine pyrophosphate-dependent enzyme [Burkholderiaceae bacterium]